MNLPADYNQMTWQERREARMQYVREQGGNCQHCGAPLSGDPTGKAATSKINWRLFPKNFRKYPVHLHHCHDTGMTIGAVHNRCNAYLWQYLGE